MKKHVILEAIDKCCTVEGGKKYLTCTDAHKIAEELNVDHLSIGNLCNENGIKIRGCQLGCF